MDALRLLLHRVFDDAGLFPPAAWPMDEAAARHAAVRVGPAADLVDRFVVPVNWLAELGAWLDAHPDAGDGDLPWRLAVLGTSIEGFRQDLAAIERFEARWGGRASAEAYEVKATPADVAPAALKPIANAGFEAAYVELPLGAESVPAWHALAESDVVGAKVRLGGLEAAAFPPAAAVAAFLREAASVDLTFKLTAGLHQPLPHTDAATGGHAHGFLNVLVAGACATAHDLSTAEVQRVLDEADPDAFWFRPDGLGWRDLELDHEAIEAFRDLCGGIGTCSVDEPVQALRDLGWLR